MGNRERVWTATRCKPLVVARFVIDQYTVGATLVVDRFVVDRFVVDRFVVDQSMIKWDSSSHKSELFSILAFFPIATYFVE